MKKTALAAASLAALLLSTPANATVITFDDLWSEDWVPEGYNGLVWNYFRYQNGYGPEVVSGTKYSYNARGYVASVNVNWGEKFTFNGGAFTSMYNDGLQLLVEGSSSKGSFTETLTLKTSEPTIMNVGWKDVDFVTFTPLYPYDLNDYGPRIFGVDNMRINEGGNDPVVPLPAAFPLFGTGLLALAAKARKRKLA